MTSVERIADRFSGIESEITGMLRARQLPASTVVTTSGNDLSLADVLGAAQDVADAAPEQAESIVILDDAQSGDLDASMEEEAAREATDDEAHEARMQAIYGEDRSNEIDAELKESRDRLDERQGRLELQLTAAGERLDAGEESQAKAVEELAALDALLAQVNDTAGSAKDDAGKALEMAPLTTEKLLAVVSTIGEAFIKSGHILDLDVGKLVVTGDTVLNEAVINELFAQVVTAKILEVTEKLIGVDGTFTGKLTVDHLDLKTLFGQRLEGLEIHGGEFVQYATDTMLPIYPASAGDIVVEDWFGGSPDAVAAAVAVTTPVFVGSTSARVSRTGAGSISAVWRNADRVPRIGTAARRVEVRLRSTVALTGVHINTTAGRADLPNLPANTWQVISVDLPQGADLAWVHVGGIAAATATVYIDEVRVLSASLQGAHVRISRDAAGIPGMFIYNAAGDVLAELTPHGLRAVDPGTGRWVQMSQGALKHSTDTDWAPIAVPGGTGTCEWSRSGDRIRLRYDFNLSTALGNGTNTNVFTVPLEARPSMIVQLEAGGTGGVGYGGYLGASGIVALSNSSGAGRTRFWGNGDWQAT